MGLNIEAKGQENGQQESCGTRYEMRNRCVYLLCVLSLCATTIRPGTCKSLVWTIGTLHLSRKSFSVLIARMLTCCYMLFSHCNGNDGNKVCCLRAAEVASV